MHDSILKFADQLAFEPHLENGPVLALKGKLIVGGMGGSNLSSALLRLTNPALDIYAHRDYGLPPLSDDVLSESLLVASSYSGNTEETLDFAASALSKGLRPAIIASGGKLAELARAKKLPLMLIPNTVIQPRVAVGVSLVALASLTQSTDVLSDLKRIAVVLKPAAEEGEGKRIARGLAAHIPLIYASQKNNTIAYNWKIKINETAKVAAFCHVFPELDHNELAGFSKNPRRPEGEFAVLLLRDATDHPRIQKRMDTTAGILKENGVSVLEVSVSGESPLEKAFRSLVIADWTAYHLSLAYGVNPDDNPAIEEFKRRMAA